MKSTFDVGQATRLRRWRRAWSKGGKDHVAFLAVERFFEKI
jgi:hypothetical protein